jgi:hypothetical protein
MIVVCLNTDPLEEEEERDRDRCIEVIDGRLWIGLRRSEVDKAGG